MRIIIDIPDDALSANEIIEDVKDALSIDEVTCRLAVRLDDGDAKLRALFHHTAEVLAEVMEQYGSAGDEETEMITYWHEKMQSSQSNLRGL